jgi:hypothetical protein
METLRISPYTLIYIWLGVGFLAGLVILLVGRSKGKTKLGAIGLLASTVGGGILGIFLIVPIVAIFLWLILRGRSNAASSGPSDTSPGDV